MFILLNEFFHNKPEDVLIKVSEITFVRDIGNEDGAYVFLKDIDDGIRVIEDVFTIQEKLSEVTLIIK